MRVAVVGCGYVGLVTGACFAACGHQVVCVDRDTAKISLLQQGKVPIYEPGLDDIIQQSIEAGGLSFCSEFASGLREAEVTFVTVGTPLLEKEARIDLSHVVEATLRIAACMRDGALIVIKSTVPVGTGDELARKVRQVWPELNFAVVSNPEFLREGAAIQDFMRPDRIVIGAEESVARDVVVELYRTTVAQDVPFVLTRRRTAELIKYAANAYLVAKISYINEMADLCETIGADVEDVAEGIGLDHRIGSAFLRAGPGYGGSCFPKDTQALLATAEAHGRQLSMVEAAVNVNNARKHVMVRKIADACGGTIEGKILAVLGLTFKPGTDDLRESPAIAIVQLLMEEGASIRAFDPAVSLRRENLADDVVLSETAYGCVQDADALVILTDWPDFAGLDLHRIRKSLRQPVVVDLRNIISPKEAAEAGLLYTSIGRMTEGGPEALGNATAIQEKSHAQ